MEECKRVVRCATVEKSRKTQRWNEQGWKGKKSRKAREWNKQGWKGGRVGLKGRGGRRRAGVEGWEAEEGRAIVCKCKLKGKGVEGQREMGQEKGHGRRANVQE